MPSTASPLARTLRQSKPNLPILPVAGYSSSAAAAADFTVLRKPIQLSELSRAAAKATAEAHAPNAANIVRLKDARRAEAAAKRHGPA